MSFEAGGSKMQLTSVGVEDLENAEKKYTVHGQILDMVASKATNQGNQSMNWIWSGQYVRFGSRNKDESSTKRQFTVHIPGQLAYPLGPMVARTPDDLHNSLSGEQIPITWSIQEVQLAEIIGYAWEALNPDTEEIISNIEMLPSIQESTMPYHNELGMFVYSLTVVQGLK
jgi:hypothetical protein